MDHVRRRRPLEPNTSGLRGVAMSIQEARGDSRRRRGRRSDATFAYLTLIASSSEESTTQAYTGNETVEDGIVFWALET